MDKRRNSVTYSSVLILSDTRLLYITQEIPSFGKKKNKNPKPVVSSILDPRKKQVFTPTVLVNVDTRKKLL